MKTCFSLILLGKLIVLTHKPPRLILGGTLQQVKGKGKRGEGAKKGERKREREERSLFAKSTNTIHMANSMAGYQGRHYAHLYW